MNRDTLDLIAHFTVDGEPVTGLIEAALDVPAWMHPLIGKRAGPWLAQRDT